MLVKVDYMNSELRHSKSNYRVLQGERPAWRKGREEREAPRSGIFLELPNPLQGLVAYLTIDHLFCPGVRAVVLAEPFETFERGAP